MSPASLGPKYLGECEGLAPHSDAAKGDTSK
jgi:hypothetical protein